MQEVKKMPEDKFCEPMPSRHAFGGANFHLQFTPKYRRALFNDCEIAHACRRELERKAAAQTRRFCILARSLHRPHALQGGVVQKLLTLLKQTV